MKGAMGRQGRNSIGNQLLGAGVLALSLGLSAPAASQQAATSQAVVQPLPGPETQVLNAALARLGKNPKDVAALVDAGNAALTLGNVDAAVGFFARADQVQPNTPQVRAGLAGALVHSGNPYDAIPLFTEAEAAGAMDKRLNAERGLAYDLVGDNATAQKYYNEALLAGPSDEVTRRLALSQAIAGERNAMEATLSPLLAKQDKAAWRTRAFALAILGRSDEAVTIAYQTMPQDLAAGMAPYLRYMPRLTKAQQAAAATFGQFPRAADIGRDDPRAAKFAPPVRVASADATLVPKGEPLGSRKPKPKTEPKPAETKLAVAQSAAPRAAPPELQPRRVETETPAQLVVPKDPPAPAPKPVAQPVAKPVQVAVAAPAPQSSVPARAAPGPASTFDLGSVGNPTVTVPAAPAQSSVTPKQEVPVPVKTAPAPAAKAPSFAEAFGDLGAPQVKAVPASGAVDIRKIAAAKPKETKPAHPSRIWVQVGTGRDKSSLAFTWRALVKDTPELFRSKSSSITDWGRTNRLLTGPFDTEAAANAFLAKLKREKIDAFLWTSPAGQVVDPLVAK